MLAGLDPKDVWLAGPALVGALLEANLRSGVDVRVEAPAVRLVTDGAAVGGVVVSVDGVERTVVATNGVLIATGGFEHSREVMTEHLGAPFATQVSPKGHNGIAVQLADEVGADLTGMQDAWWMPAVLLPGEELEGQPLARVFLGERALPHSIMVNSAGERFANEALAYDQFGAIMREADPETGEMPNALAWLIFDQNYWDKYGIFGVTPGGEVPDFIRRADSLARLAGEIGVDEVGLLRTVDEFNPEARIGRDSKFHRGETLFDRYFGAYYPRLGKNSPDARFPSVAAKARMLIGRTIGPVVNKLAASAAAKSDPEALRKAVVAPLAKIIRPVLNSPRSSVLGPVEKAPFYAVKVEASALGTVGGPGPTAGARRSTPRGTSSQACTPQATPAVRPRRASTAAPVARSRWDWSSATWPDSRPHTGTRQLPLRRRGSRAKPQPSDPDSRTRTVQANRPSPDSAGEGRFDGSLGPVHRLLGPHRRPGPSSSDLDRGRVRRATDR